MKEKARLAISFILVQQPLVGPRKGSRYCLSLRIRSICSNSIYYFEAIWLRNILEELDHQ